MITDERWQLIKEIFQSAQDLTPVERSGFLDEACGDDKSIREEVEALLEADAGNDDFLSVPALEFAAGMIAGEGTEFTEGDTIGRYTVLCPLGSGGMGQIYLAQDSQLGRKVALKLISREFATDQRRVNRFQQEARAISSLNHPNICVIHEIGMTAEDRHFIAMEYIQGSTVRERLSRGGFSIREAVNVALQVAAALASAHAAGVVHRDIKPENIMLRPDGIVKVLDFGLAKLVERFPEQQSWQPVPTNVLTEAGTLMGTVKYMSPEQLREADIDERTDIWSLGVVLYEMLMNSTPFEAQTSNETVALILLKQPTPLKFRAEVPRRLQEIVSKALDKEQAERYQTITKFAADLKSLRSLPVDEIVPGSLTVHPQTHEIPPALFTRIKSQAVSTADFLIGEIRSHKAAAVFAGATTILLLLFFLPNFIRDTPAIEMRALTTSGTSMSSAISSDEKFFAHAERDQGKQRLLITSTSTSTDFEVAPLEDVEYLGLTFSRDNNYLYFTRREKATNDGTPEKSILYRVPVMSKSPMKVLDDVDSPIAFSPNGDRFAFVRLDTAKREYSLMLSDVAGAKQQPLGARRNGETLSVSGPAWSPDGSMVVCGAGAWSEGFQMKLIGFDVQTRSERTLADQSWFAIRQVAWRDDMSAMVVNARERDTTPDQLWQITYPAGTTQRITTDLAEYEGVSLAGNKIVTVRTIRSWNIWLTTFGDSPRSSSIASGTGFAHGITWTRTGQIIYSTMVLDRLNLVRIDPNGSNRVNLTNTGDNYNPAASADGKLLVFSSNRNDGRSNIWRINSADGSDAKQLTFTDGNYYPSVSPDNHWVAYDQQTELTLTSWKVPLEGGESIKVIEGYRMPVFSPNSQLIAGRFDRESGTTDVAIFPASGGPVFQHFTIRRIDWQRVQWIDDHTLSFISDEGGPVNLWSYDLRTDTAKQLTNFESGQIFAYSWSPDFKQVACQRGQRIRDVTMITQ